MGDIRIARMFHPMALLLHASLVAMPVAAPVDSFVKTTRISGLTFGDVYWNADGDPVHRYEVDTGADSGKVNLDASGRPITRDLSGVQIRRIDLQVDHDLAPDWSGRLRLEMDNHSLTSDGKMSPFIKNAYLQRKHLGPLSDALVGMMDTPT